MSASTSDPFVGYLMPKLKRAHRDRGAAEVLKALAAGRSLENAILDTIESLPASETRKLRLWIEEARGLSRERRDPEADETAGDELLITLDSDADMYKWKQRVAEMLLKKINAGKYDHKQAWKAWSPIVDAAAKQYAKEFATPREWSTIFTPATRDYVSHMLADRWYANAKAGRPGEV